VRSQSASRIRDAEIPRVLVAPLMQGLNSPSRSYRASSEIVAIRESFSTSAFSRAGISLSVELRACHGGLGCATNRLAVISFKNWSGHAEAGGTACCTLVAIAFLILGNGLMFSEDKKLEATYDYSAPGEQKIKLAESAAPLEVSSNASVDVLKRSSRPLPSYGVKGCS